MNPKLSIIIITLNEERYLPRLLETIKRQDYKDYEIVVSDGNSKDKTVQIARKAGCRVIRGSKSPAQGRNYGAKIAKGRHLLFLDSDAELPDCFLTRLMKRFNDEHLDIAGCFFKPIPARIRYECLLFAANWYNKALQGISPRAPGWCILTTREMYNKVRGFDEGLYLAEDHDFVCRASRVGRFKYLTKPKIRVSIRRLEENRGLKMIFNYIYCEMYLFLNKKVKKKIYCYDFGKHG